MENVSSRILFLSTAARWVAIAIKRRKKKNPPRPTFFPRLFKRIGTLRCSRMPEARGRLPAPGRLLSLHSITHTHTHVKDGRDPFVFWDCWIDLTVFKTASSLASLARHWITLKFRLKHFRSEKHGSHLSKGCLFFPPLFFCFGWNS